MKKFVTIIILNLFFVTSSHADDIRDLQIEGISIGDSALKYFSKELIKNDIAVIAISSNDVSTHPDDSFENMQALSFDKKLPFPYLYDKTQEVAKTYDAACTPDFFGFNSELSLQYRGRLNNKRESPNEIRRELYSAMIEIAKSGKGPREQIPSMGCSIKWKS